MPDARQPLVSILTPSFNQARWLGDNLASVSCQTYLHVEHIVMDGGSNDGSVEILEAAGESIRWRSESDRGQSHAINKAFSESRGEIIGWLNSDDAYFDCQVVESAVALFSASPDVDIIYGHALKTTGEGAFIQVLWAPPFDHDLLKAVDFIVQPAAFIRRSALTDPMLNEEYHFAMDYELWMRLAKQGHTFERLNRVMAVDRHQPERKSSTIKDVYEHNLALLAERYDMNLGPEWERKRSAFYVKQRIFGALQIPLLRGQYAFTAPADAKSGLWGRQILTRRSTWPTEYR